MNVPKATPRGRGFAGNRGPRSGVPASASFGQPSVLASLDIRPCSSSPRNAGDTVPARPPDVRRQATPSRCPRLAPRPSGGLLALTVLCVFAQGCITGRVGPKTFDATLEVDFGPANRPAIHRVVSVDRGTTPDGLVAKLCSLEKGSVCCNPRETAGIDGVAADPAANR